MPRVLPAAAAAVQGSVPAASIILQAKQLAGDHWPGEYDSQAENRLHHCALTATVETRGDQRPKQEYGTRLWCKIYIRLSPNTW